MGDRLRYDQGAIGTAVGDIVAAGNTLEGVHQNIDSDVKRLFGTWTEGVGKEAYTAYQTQWTTIFIDVKTALSQIGKAVEIAGANAAKTDKAIADAFTV